MTSEPGGRSSEPVAASVGVEDVTAVVPVRNGQDMLPGCLESLRRNGVERIIVVDGESVDRSRDIARAAGATVYSDAGAGLPAARTLGVDAADTPWVLLIDCDVRLPDGALTALLEEFSAGQYAALQAGQLSVSGPGYWGQALVHHHRNSRSRRWFGLVATVVERRLLLDLGFDDAFKSGEDIELRWRMQSAGLKVGVSEAVAVEHRFAGDDFAFAKDQFLMDGRGLGLMLTKHGWTAAPLVLLPAAAAARGIALSLAHQQPKWIPYYGAYCLLNYVGMFQGVRR